MQVLLCSCTDKFLGIVLVSWEKDIISKNIYETRWWLFEILWISKRKNCFMHGCSHFMVVLYVNMQALNLQMQMKNKATL